MQQPERDELPGPSYSVRHVDNSIDWLWTYYDSSGWVEPEFRADVTICDPPYDLHCMSNMCSGSLVGTKSVPKRTNAYSHVDVEKIVPLLLDVTRRWVVVFCTVEALGRIRDACPSTYVRGCIYQRTNAMGQLTRDRPASACEGVAVLHAGGTKKRWNGKGSYNVWPASSPRGKVDKHPQQKSLDLMLKLVALFSERGETVFDPFAGSGTTGQACAMLGRSFVGLDRDAEWVEKARARIEAARLAPVTDEAALALCRMAPARQAKKRSTRSCPGRDSGTRTGENPSLSAWRRRCASGSSERRASALDRSRPTRPTTGPAWR